MKPLRYGLIAKSSIMLVLAVLGSCTKPDGSIEPAFHEEPIIIEESSVVVDFSPKKNNGNHMENENNGENIHRKDGFDLKSVRLWKKGPSTSYAWKEYLCGGKVCNFDQKHFFIDTTSGKTLKLYWNGHNNPISLKGGAPGTLKHVSPSRNYIAETQDATWKIDVVHFKSTVQQEDIDLREDDKDTVYITLCPGTDGGGCAKPK